MKRKFPISNFQFPISSGFTIIEVLASLALILGIGGIIGSIVYSSVRGTTKAGTIINVRQNGQYALSQMEKTIQNATGITSPCSPTPIPAQSITLANIDGSTTTFTCGSTGIITTLNIPQNLTPMPIAPLTDSSVIIVTPTPTGTPLCSFSCSSNGVGSYPTILIQFTLDNSSTSNFFEQRSPTAFRSTVTFRNPLQ